MKISIIAAVAGKNRALGYKNHLLYHLPDDMRFFKNKTTGHTIIMGKKTFDSFPKGALPNRRNIVLSRSVSKLPGCDVYDDLSKALESCKNDNEVFIIGGASVYKQALNLADTLYLTEIHDEPENADVFFPEIPKCFDVKYASEHDVDEKHKVPFAFVEYIKI